MPGYVWEREVPGGVDYGVEGLLPERSVLPHVLGVDAELLQQLVVTDRGDDATEGDVAAGVVLVPSAYRKNKENKISIGSAP